jgi:hypothetical protein
MGVLLRDQKTGIQELMELAHHVFGPQLNVMETQWDMLSIMDVRIYPAPLVFTRMLRTSQFLLDQLKYVHYIWCGSWHGEQAASAQW